MTSQLCGIDLGGTKIEIILLDADLKTIDRFRSPTHSHLGYKHILNQINKLILQMEDKHQLHISKFGIGTPGSVDPATHTLKNSNTLCLNGKNIRQDLIKITNKELVISNDANCFAVAESVLGAALDLQHPVKLCFGVIMGTGVGGGIVIDGKIHNGINGIAGEWGHNILDESGGPCYCGKIGCVEKIISGPALESYYKLHSDEHKNLADIILLARGGTDIIAIETLNRLCYYFGKAISNVINMIDPDVIILGGGLSNIDELYTTGREYAKQFVFNPTLQTAFLRPKLGDSAGVIGAALMVR